jgi:small GTP-binding protein
MSLSIGIVGLPNAGKSTLFNALVKGHQAKVADYPFTTIEPNVGMVEVPDERLDKIAEVLKLSKKIPTTIKFIDIAGLVKNAHKGEGLGNQFLSHIREVDAIVHVLDGFSKDSNPKESRENVNIELELAEIKKPTLYVLNVKEGELRNAQRGSSDTIIISAKLEEELTDFSDNEAKQYLQSLGLAESGLIRLINKSYNLLNLITFYTLIFNKQVQTWSIIDGSTAPQAAGKVHTDMERGFIAADVCHYRDLIDAGGWQNAQHKGKVRTEGKDYFIQDGDIIHFRFNV